MVARRRPDDRRNSILSRASEVAERAEDRKASAVALARRVQLRSQQQQITTAPGSEGGHRYVPETPGGQFGWQQPGIQRRKEVQHHVQMQRFEAAGHHHLVEGNSVISLISVVVNPVRKNYAIFHCHICIYKRCHIDLGFTIHFYNQ